MSSDHAPLDFPEQTFLRVSLEHIVPNPQQPRKQFPDKSLQELAQSIKVQGVLQPLVVRKHPSLANRYELVAGERRWRALKQLEVSQVPVILRKVGDDELLEVALLENIQRENLSVIEEAQSYQDLLQSHGYTQEELARRIGKDRSTIANQMRLLLLPSPLKNDLETGRITAGHARTILALPSTAFQLEMRGRLLLESWSVRETERQVRLKLDFLAVSPQKLGNKNTAHGGASENLLSKAEKDTHLQNLEEELQRRLRTRVEIKFREGKGQIKIDYFSLEEFERLYDLLTSC
ncbi:MAG: ParB/RepB/Spo0J family partition protein [Proteobacteria bacterium]|jgi:ParB family chromosome partitioning protein|nr:ParB/RepB/Spo0J family partition protein [Pseudomonadota bacterium]MBT5794678.1 ParB/RepB/Spo0J family partition protein [Deltaproteobacteria bacterium]